MILVREILLQQRDDAIAEMRAVKEKEDQLRALLEKMRADKNTLISQVEAKEKDYFLLKTQFALYQTRAKTEQEKLLKEMVLYKEQSRRENEQWQENIKLKDNEIRMVAESARIRESELKQQLDKKEHEAASAERYAEEKFRSRENELKQSFERLVQEAASSAKSADEKYKARETEFKYILEKKDDDIKNAVKQGEDKLGALKHDYTQQLELKDKELRSQQVQWAEKVQAKEKELSGILEKAREHCQNWPVGRKI